MSERGEIIKVLKQGIFRTVRNQKQLPGTYKPPKFPKMINNSGQIPKRTSSCLHKRGTV